MDCFVQNIQFGLEFEVSRKITNLLDNLKTKTHSKPVHCHIKTESYSQQTNYVNPFITNNSNISTDTDNIIENKNNSTFSNCTKINNIFITCLPYTSSDKYLVLLVSRKTNCFANTKLYTTTNQCD